MNQYSNRPIRSCHKGAFLGVPISHPQNSLLVTMSNVQVLVLRFLVERVLGNPSKNIQFLLSFRYIIKPSRAIALAIISPVLVPMIGLLQHDLRTLSD